MVNANITKMKTSKVGEYKIKDLEINGQSVPVVTSMKKNSDDEITELYLNEVEQKLALNAVNGLSIVPVFVSEYNSLNGFLVMLDNNAEFLDSFTDLSNIETVIWFGPDTWSAFSVLSTLEYREKYGNSLSLIDECEITFNSENQEFSIVSGGLTYKIENVASTPDDMDIVQLATLGRYK